MVNPRILINRAMRYIYYLNFFSLFVFNFFKVHVFKKNYSKPFQTLIPSIYSYYNRISFKFPSHTTIQLTKVLSNAEVTTFYIELKCQTFHLI